MRRPSKISDLSAVVAVVLFLVGAVVFGLSLYRALSHDLGDPVWMPIEVLLAVAAMWLLVLPAGARLSRLAERD